MQAVRRDICDRQLEVQASLGWGSCGVVYRGTWKGLPVAVKVLLLQGDCHARRPYLMEAAISSRCVTWVMAWELARRAAALHACMRIHTRASACLQRSKVSVHAHVWLSAASVWLFAAPSLDGDWGMGESPDTK